MADAKKPAKPAAETVAVEEAPKAEAPKAEAPKLEIPKAALTPETPKLEMPQMSQMPPFDLPRVEFPAAYRELAEKGLAQAKQNYERMKAVAQESSDLIETTYANASKGAAEYSLKIIEAMRANVNANFDFLASLMAVKSPSEVVELSSAHARKTFETVSAQSKELASLAQKVSNDTAEPIKAGFNKALRLVA